MGRMLARMICMWGGCLGCRAGVTPAECELCGLCCCALACSGGLALEDSCLSASA